MDKPVDCSMPTCCCCWFIAINVSTMATMTLCCNKQLVDCCLFMVLYLLLATTEKPLAWSHQVATTAMQQATMLLLSSLAMWQQLSILLPLHCLCHHHCPCPLLCCLHCCATNSSLQLEAFAIVVCPAIIIIVVLWVIEPCCHCPVHSVCAAMSWYCWHCPAFASCAVAVSISWLSLAACCLPLVACCLLLVTCHLLLVIYICCW